MEDAHESIIWDVSWNPMGHMLVSGSNDRSTRFWTRNRPGDTIADKSDEASTSNAQTKVERVTGIIFKNIDITVEGNAQKEDGLVSLPGLGLEKDLLEKLKQNQDTQYDNSFDDDADKMDYPPKHPEPQSLPELMQIKRDSIIPGLEIDEDEKRRRAVLSMANAKSAYSKPIPKEFEKAWKSNAPVSNGASSSSSSTTPSQPTSGPIPLVDQLANKNSIPVALMNIVPQILPGFQPPLINTINQPPPSLMNITTNIPSQQQTRQKRKDFDDLDERDSLNNSNENDDFLKRQRRQNTIY